MTTDAAGNATVTLAATPGRQVFGVTKGDRIRDQFVQQTGAIDAITKPFDAQALVAVVENALRKVNSTRASSARLPEIDPDDMPTGVGPSPASLPPGVRPRAQAGPATA